MSYITESFSAGLTQTMETDAVTLPVSASALADLTKLLDADGAYTFASIKSDATFETVKLYLSAGTLVVDRAQEGTEAVKHPCGSVVCLVSPTIVAALKALVCEYDCCEDDCGCEGVAYAGSFLPTATVGTEWQGAVVFSGKLPITFAVKDQPSWMTVLSQDSVVNLSGTPTLAGTYRFTLAAANCSGSHVDIADLSLTVNDS